MTKSRWNDAADPSSVPMLLERCGTIVPKAKQTLPFQWNATPNEGDFRPFFRSVRSTLLTRGMEMERFALQGRCA